MDDIRAATDEEITEIGLQTEPEEKLWFVTCSIAMKEGHAGDLDGDAVYPEDEDWTGVTSTGGELKQSEVILARTSTAPRTSRRPAASPTTPPMSAAWSS